MMHHETPNARDHDSRGNLLTVTDVSRLSTLPPEIFRKLIRDKALTACLGYDWWILCPSSRGLDQLAAQRVLPANLDRRLKPVEVLDVRTEVEP